MLWFAFLPALLLAAGERPVTLDAASQPRPKVISPVWAPDASRFAYEEDGRLKLYERSRGASRELLRIKSLDAKEPPAAPATWENRNVAEHRLQWFPDGRLLLNLDGQLFIVAPDGSARRLALSADRVGDPKLSPDGTLLAFRHAHNLWVRHLATGRERRLTRDGSPTRRNGEPDWVYPEELDLSTAYWWSPDSHQIAYLQFDVSAQLTYPHADLTGALPVYEPQRYPRAGTPNARVRLGVVSAAGGATRWMNTGADPEAYLARAAWMPGSREVAVIRLNRPQTRLDLLACTAASGRQRLLLSETDPFWINVTDDWRFLADGRRFLWSSERDGYRHLYLYSTDGRQLAQLTRGDWEVSSLTGVDEKAGAVYYLAGLPNPLERQLFRVPLTGGASTRVTTEPGTHDVSMAPGAQAWLARHSAIDTPPRQALFTAEGRLEATLVSRPTVEYALQPYELVHFTGADGALRYGRLLRPPHFDPARKYPLVVLVYGGPGRQTVTNSWQGVGIDQLMAARGWVVWQMDNRGTSGRGHRWESALHRQLGKVELEDQKEGVEWLAAQGFIDRRRVGIHGSSYGGFLTIYSLLHAPESFQAGVAGAPVTDWRNYDTIYTERYLQTPAANPKGYLRSSLVPDAAKLKGNLLIVHNMEDDNVLFQNTLQMMEAFERAGRQVNLRLYPQKTHGITGAYRRNLLEGVLAFFEERWKAVN